MTLPKVGSRELFVKEVTLPLSTSAILGNGIDATTLPEGHLSCPQCKGHLWEAWVYMDAHRVEMGCRKCNWNCRILFPMDVVFPNSGRWSCKKHPDLGVVLIHNVDVINIGCERCYRDITFKLRKAQGLILAEDLD
jgi:hypothetical protein